MNQLTRAQQRIVEQNLNLARSVANKFRNMTAIEYEELESIAFLALSKAIANYDKSRGAISSYAIPYIRGEILHYLRDKANTIKTPRNKERLHVASLDAPIAEDLTLLDTIASSSEIDDQLSISVDEIEEKLEILSKRERQVLELKIQGLKNKQISERLKISVGTIGVTFNRAKKKINAPICRYDPKDYANKDLSSLTPKEQEVFELYLADFTNHQIAERLDRSIQAVGMTLTRSRRILDAQSHNASASTKKRRTRSPRSTSTWQPDESRPVISNCTIAARLNNGWTIDEIAFSFGITPEEARSRANLILWRNRG